MNLYNKNCSGYLELIVGPMFSGKTTKLIEIYNEKCKNYGKEKCLAINYALDKRYSNEDKIVSHDNVFIDCYSVYDLDDFLDEKKLQKILLQSDYVFINEAQFFPNLFHLILFIKNRLNKHIVLCGLDLDYKREKFGEMMDLIPYANNIHELSGKCNTKGCCFPSQFSHRLVKFENQLLIGNTCYVPLCKLCYEIENEKSDENKENEESEESGESEESEKSGESADNKESDKNDESDVFSLEL